MAGAIALDDVFLAMRSNRRGALAAITEAMTTAPDTIWIVLRKSPTLLFGWAVGDFIFSEICLLLPLWFSRGAVSAFRTRMCA
jgi:hypothetical protein